MASCLLEQRTCAAALGAHSSWYPACHSDCRRDALRARHARLLCSGLACGRQPLPVTRDYSPAHAIRSAVFRSVNCVRVIELFKLIVRLALCQLASGARLASGPAPVDAAVSMPLVCCCNIYQRSATARWVRSVVSSVVCLCAGVNTAPPSEHTALQSAVLQLQAAAELLYAGTRTARPTLLRDLREAQILPHRTGSGAALVPILSLREPPQLTNAVCGGAGCRARHTVRLRHLVDTVCAGHPLLPLRVAMASVQFRVCSASVSAA
jgi:hypothetical protein